MRMRTSLIVAILFASGCTYVGWDDVPGAHVHPTGDESPFWWAQVANAVGTWNQMAREAGCPQPFAMSLEANGAHPIAFVSADEWNSLDGIKTDKDVGLYRDEYEDDVGTIYIRDRGRDDYVNVILHELGHALGLDHDETPGDIMNLKVPEQTVPSPHDVERMRGELGC